MTPIERLVLWVGAVLALLAMLTAGYNFVGGRELTSWSDSLYAWVVHVDGEIPHGPGDHVPPPDDPPPW